MAVVDFPQPPLLFIIAMTFDFAILSSGMFDSFITFFFIIQISSLIGFFFLKLVCIFAKF